MEYSFYSYQKSDLVSWTEQMDNSSNGFTSLNLSNTKRKNDNDGIPEMINRTYFCLECFDMIHSYMMLVFVFQPDYLIHIGNPCSHFDQCNLDSCLQIKQPWVHSLDSRQSWKSISKQETNEMNSYDELSIQIYQTEIFPIVFLMNEQNESQMTILGSSRNIPMCQE